MHTHQFLYPLGILLKDKITGFQGRVVHRVEFITGCDQYGLQPEGLDDKGAPKAIHQYDENRLEVIDATPIVIHSESVKTVDKLPKKRKPGGPQPYVGK